MTLLLKEDRNYKVNIKDMKNLLLNIHNLGPTGPNYIDDNDVRIISLPGKGSEIRIEFILENVEPKITYKYSALNMYNPSEYPKDLIDLTEEQEKYYLEHTYKTNREQNKEILEDGTIIGYKEKGRISFELTEISKNETNVEFLIEHNEGDKWFFIQQNFIGAWIDLAIPKYIHSTKIIEISGDVELLSSEIGEIKAQIDDIDVRIKNLELTSQKFSLLIIEEDKTLKETVNDLLLSQFDNWVFLEENSRIFLQTAEIIRTRFGAELDDYCPVVISYAKAFETECNIKIFDRFRKVIHSKFGKDLQEIIKNDLQQIPRDSMRAFSPLCRFLEGKREIELGMMNIFLGLSTGKTAENSKILQEFRDFLSSISDEKEYRTGKEDTYLPRIIEKIRQDCRNGSAHIEKIPYDKAQWCITFITESLNELNRNLKMS